MLIKLILLITIAIISVKGERFEPERPDEDSKTKGDAARWAQLQKRYVTNELYAPFIESMKKRCRIVKECCPNQRDHLFSILQGNNLIETCIGMPGTALFNSHTALCVQLIHDHASFIGSNEYTEVARVAITAGINSRWVDRRSKMLKVCSKTELTAYYCDPKNMVPFKSCAEKVLRLVESENDEEYSTFVRSLKKDYDYHDKLSL